MKPVSFKTKLFKIGSWTILHVPVKASAQFSSRGMLMIDGTINNFAFTAPLEPDGRGSHWMRINAAISKGARIAVGDTIAVTMVPAKVWPLPTVPNDIKEALTKATQAQALWTKITPSAQWEWIRWIRATNVAETRQRRILVAVSKLTHGERRPCCFNRNVCTEPYVAHNWMLRVPT